MSGDSTEHDLLAIGNAIVDVIAEVDDGFPRAHGLVKGSMQLVDAARAERLYEAMPAGIEASGGSAANTAAAVASLGGRAAFIGKVRADQLGAVFVHDIRAVGVAFDSTPARSGPHTARCLIVVTPDAERTMSTSLGIAGQVTVDDIDRDVVRGAAFTYCEGYLWDLEPTKAAIRLAIDMAHEAGRKVAITLSDGFCVERHRAEFRELATTSADVLFANEDEIKSLYEVAGFDQALAAVRAEVPLAFLTRGPRGAVVVRGGEAREVPAHPGVKVVDTTGAGDAFAAGALYGMVNGISLEDCARLGALAAGEVIGHIGPRPRVSLRELATGILEAKG